MATKRTYISPFGGVVHFDANRTYANPLDSIVSEQLLTSGAITATGDLASGDSDMSGVANVVVGTSGDLQSGDSSMNGSAVVVQNTSGDLQSGDSSMLGAASVSVDASGDLQAVDSEMAGVVNVVSVDNVNSGAATVDGQQNISFETTGYPGEITTAQIRSGTSVTNGTGVTSTSGDGDFDVFDISAITIDTLGSFFTTASHSIVYRLSDGSITKDFAGAHNPKTGFKVTEVRSVVNDVGSFSENFVSEVLDTCQVLYPDTDNNNITEGGASVSITGATQADPVVLTVTNTFNNGDTVSIKNVVGMTEINDRLFTVANRTGTTIELEGEDGTGHTAYISGGDVAIAGGIFTSDSVASVDMKFGDISDDTWKPFSAIVGVESSGDLVSGNSSMAGVVNVIVSASGNLQSADSDMDGSASFGVNASGNLQASDSSMAGVANVIMQASGDLQASNSEMSGAVNIIISASGDLASGDSEMNGLAASGDVITSGNLQASDSQMAGVANVVINASGNLQSGDSQLDATANITVSVSGNLQSSDSQMDGNANSFDGAVASGNLQATSSEMSGVVNVIVSASGDLSASNSQMIGAANILSPIILVDAPKERTYDIEFEDRTFNVLASDKKMKRIPKDPSATLNYSFRIVDWLDDDDSLASFVLIKSSGITIESSSSANDIVTAAVSGGSPQGDESLVCRFTTTNGYTDERTIIFEMGNR